MKVSNQGIEFLKRVEGCVIINNQHVIYDDATGQPVPTGAELPIGATIGYGHLIRRGEDFNQGLSEMAADTLLRADVAIAAHAVDNYIYMPLAQHQYDALVSLAFNIGVVNFKESTLVKYINDPKFYNSMYPNPERAWKAWNTSRGRVSRGLVNRRRAEWDMFARGIY
ncbi:MAG: lysozyme [Alphaproteobacteria bacterium]|nr:lysozyme [Alphaproteobacteria bacterium]